MMIQPYYQDEYATIYHADCLDVMPQLSGVDLVLTSPPYNVGMEYEEVMDWPEYYKFSKEWLSASLACLKDVGFLPREAIIWAKGNEGEPIAPTSRTGSDNNIYIRSTCEMILLHSKSRYYWEGGTGRRGYEVVPWMDETKDIWWINTARRNGHPCPWPREIPHRLISMFTLDRKAQPLVVDPFMGSGETIVVAKYLKRKCIGIEKELKYCRLAVSKLNELDL